MLKCACRAILKGVSGLNWRILNGKHKIEETLDELNVCYNVQLSRVEYSHCFPCPPWPFVLIVPRLRNTDVPGEGGTYKRDRVLVVPFRELKKERFWYLLMCLASEGPQRELLPHRVFSKFLTSTPVLFKWECPSPRDWCIPQNNTLN